MGLSLERCPLWQTTARVVLVVTAAAMACTSPPARSFEMLTASATGPANGPWAGPLLEPKAGQLFTGTVLSTNTGQATRDVGPDSDAVAEDADGISFGGRPGLCVGSTDPSGQVDPCPVRFQTLLGGLPEDTPAFDPQWTATVVDGLLEGVLTILSPDSVILAHISYRAGRDEGPATFFYPSGVMERRGDLRDGAEVGTWEYFHANGQLQERVTLLDHHPVGEWSAWYDDGQLRGSGSYSPSGELAGTWQFYYPNGQLKQRVDYVDGQSEGDWEVYHENGQLHERGAFVGGLEQGPWQVFDEAGALEAEGYLHQGVRCGEWRVERSVVQYDPCPDHRSPTGA